MMLWGKTAGWQRRTLWGFVSTFVTVVADNGGVDSRSRRRQFWIKCRNSEGWMCELALFAVRTEATQVIRAKNTSTMTMFAVVTVSAKTSVIPGTIFKFWVGIDVSERTFFVWTRFWNQTILIKMLAMLKTHCILRRRSIPAFYWDRIRVETRTHRLSCTILSTNVCIQLAYLRPCVSKDTNHRVGIVLWRSDHKLIYHSCPCRRKELHDCLAAPLASLRRRSGCRHIDLLCSPSSDHPKSWTPSWPGFWTGNWKDR